MKLTNAQRDAVSYDGNVLVVACPGSGKTRTLIAKLLRCLDDVRGTARRIACITYTNAAVYEIEKRLRLYGATGDEEYCDISTIHAFCLDNILRFFFWRLDSYQDGFTILPSDSERFQEIVASVCSEFGLDSKAYDSFELLNREPDGTPIVQSPITDEIAYYFWERLSQEQFIDFTNIVYFSYYLMTNWPSITHALSCRYAWFLVDEFQDTSALQVEILKLIAEGNRTKFFLVGDPYQSIFRFAGARPHLMTEFADQINACSDFALLTNWCSSEPIINHAERLLPRTPSMHPCATSAMYTYEPQYIHVETAFEGITDYFIPALNEFGIEFGNAAILAPWWIKLLHLGRELREYGVPIIGPGARPYKRSHLLALLAEHICAYIEHPDPYIIFRIERELFRLISNVTGKANYGIFSYKGRLTVFRLIRIGEAIRQENVGAINWLREIAEKYARILHEDEFLPQIYGQLFIESVNDMEQEMMKHGMDVANLTVDDLGMFASLDRNMKLLTIHRAKGREFDAVAIIDLHNGRLPHFSATSLEEINEARRLFYVSITRARHVLMYLTDEEDWRNEPTPFLFEDGLGILSSTY